MANRDEAFVEYALNALLRDVEEIDGLLAAVTVRLDELKAILNIPARLRPERIERLRELCAAQDIGYAIIGTDHIFFKISGRRFEGGVELERFIQTVDEFEGLYGSEKAEEVYASQSYPGIHTSAPSKARKSARVVQVRGR